MEKNLIYDVGMYNGDDTAYYLSRGFRVIAIEANPLLVQQATQRFDSEIAAGILNILNIGISAREGALPFWVCDGHMDWSSFDLSNASRDGVDHHQITVPCRRFGSILEEFGTPYYLKIDIEGNDKYCLQDLIVSDLPKYVSFEKGMLSGLESLTYLHNLGYTGFKLIGQSSQSSYLPLEYPPTREQRRYERAKGILTSGNFIFRVLRNAGARSWLKRQVDRPRSRREWIFPPGSSGPFAEDTLGKWQSFEEMVETLAKANSAWDAREPSLFWDDKNYSFWVDFHAMRKD